MSTGRRELRDRCAECRPGLGASCSGRTTWDPSPAGGSTASRSLPASAACSCAAAWGSSSPWSRSWSASGRSAPRWGARWSGSWSAVGRPLRGLLGRRHGRLRHRWRRGGLRHDGRRARGRCRRTVVDDLDSLRVTGVAAEQAERGHRPDVDCEEEDQRAGSGVHHPAGRTAVPADRAADRFALAVDPELPALGGRRPGRIGTPGFRWDPTAAGRRRPGRRDHEPLQETPPSPPRTLVRLVDRLNTQANDTGPTQATYGFSPPACRAGFFDQPMDGTAIESGRPYRWPRARAPRPAVWSGLRRTGDPLRSEVRRHRPPA